MALGVPPNKLKAWRLSVARAQHWVKGRGCFAVAMAINCSHDQDPLYRLRVEQVKMWVEIVKRSGVLALHALTTAWELSWNELLEVKHRWMVVKGPMAATQAVLMDLGWTAYALDKWMDPQFKLWELNYGDVSLPCELETKIVCSIQRLEGRVIDSQLCCHHVGGSLDLQFHKSLLRKSSATEMILLQVLWQGSLCCSNNSQLKECPFCPNQERTWHHMFYEFPGCIKEHGPVPPVWAPCVGNLGMDHFWCRGLVPRHWTAALPVTDENLVAVGIFHDAKLEPGSAIFLGTDGSGGPLSDDPRLRKSAWAVVAFSMVG